MLKQIALYTEQPQTFKQNETTFWNEPHISAQMLKAHLNPDFEGASRTLPFIEQSVSWISGIIPPAENPQLLDAGCGPGIYAERFARLGYQVTGIDFSERSITYAAASAREKKLDIKYRYENYLHMDEPLKYDAAVLIYCDYGALAPQDRKKLLGNLYKSLKAGGKLLLDVFSRQAYHQFSEGKSWEHYKNGGFWRPDNYLQLQNNKKYPDYVTLEQTILVTETDSYSYYIWHQYFSLSQLEAECKAAGFRVCSSYADAAGKPYDDDSETIAVLLEKQG